MLIAKNIDYSLVIVRTRTSFLGLKLNKVDINVKRTTWSFISFFLFKCNFFLLSCTDFNAINLNAITMSTLCTLFLVVFSLILVVTINLGTKIFAKYKCISQRNHPDFQQSVTHLRGIKKL